MRTVTKRELNQNTAAVLEQAAEGDVVVTERGEPRWTVSGYRAAGSALERMERDGLYTAPSGDPQPWPDAVGGPSYTGAEVDALLDEMRGDH
jgi:prevent-host-death family protein